MQQTVAKVILYTEVAEEEEPTWLCTVLSWLLKVMVRLVEVLGATCVIKGVLLWLTVSYMLTRRLQISMFWKHDLTLRGGGHILLSSHFKHSTAALAFQLMPTSASS